MSTSSATTADRRRGSPAAVALIVLGSLVGLLALALLAAGGGLLWADKTQRDSTGYFTTTPHRFATGTYALTHEGVDLEDLPSWIDSGKLGSVRIRATAADSDRPLFVGIAPQSTVSRYLSGTSYTRVSDLELDPFKATYERSGGTARPAAPGSHHLWVASTSGRGDATLTWDVREGTWAVVVMNGDASRGVAADVSFGADVNYLGWITVGLFAGGGILLGIAILLVSVGARGVGSGGPGEPARTDQAAPAGPAGGGAPPATVYPAAIAGRLDEPLSRWLWIVKWLLAIPHYVVLAILWIAFVLLTIVAWFAILVTGRYPRGIFDFNVGVLRWTWRVAYYSSSALGTDRYPPFSLGEEPDYPATLSVEYPERLSRGLVLVKSWLLALPHLVIAGILGGGLWLGWASDSWRGGGGLVGLLVLIAGVILLFTGRYPRSLYDLVLGLDRWIFRVVVYVGLMRDEYPPFRLDQGGEEPPSAPGALSPPIAAGA